MIFGNLWDGAMVQPELGQRGSVRVAEWPVRTQPGPTASGPPKPKGTDCPCERDRNSRRIECRHVGQQRTVYAGVRELIFAGEYMRKLVLQAHRGAAQCPPGKPGTA